MKTVCVFHATRKPNAKGELNWYEFREIPKLSCVAYNEIIGSHSVTSIPNVQGLKSPFVAYADDEGLCSDDYARNDLAGGALHALGFRDSHILGMAYANTVIVTGHTGKCNDKSLTKAQQKTILDAIVKFRKAYYESEEEEEEEAEESKKEIPEKKKRTRQSD